AGVGQEGGADAWRKLDVERHDRRPEARREVEGPLVEVADPPGGDAHALGTQIGGVTGLSQDAVRALEDLHPSHRVALVNGPEVPDEGTNDCKRDDLPE